MQPSLAQRLIRAIDSGHLYSEVIPVDSAANPSAHDLFAAILTIDDEEIARVGFWKNAPGGPIGNGAARVHADGAAVNVTAGEGMTGSFSVEFDNETEAEEVAQVLRDTLDAEYEAIEVENVEI